MGIFMSGALHVGEEAFTHCLKKHRWLGTTMLEYIFGALSSQFMSMHELFQAANVSLQVSQMAAASAGTVSETPILLHSEIPMTIVKMHHIEISAPEYVRASQFCQASSLLGGIIQDRLYKSL